jgi:hypothetical protein
MTNEHKLYLDLGHAAVCLDFPNQPFVDNAIHQLFLDKRSQHEPAGEIRFVEDNAIQAFSHPACRPNAVYIRKAPLENGYQKVTLRLFDQYTIILEAQLGSVTVRYTADAPVSLLLDDVLQAALHWVLESLGGFLLHGSCVVRDNTAIAIMGISGAGKSTTAFNLTRFGFNCYADDAVLVVPADGALTVRPFTREISIRPLTFRLLEQHGVLTSDYRKDGEKYYFNPEKDALPGANLKFACFVEVSGESDTVLSVLSKEKFMQTLVEERKHFTFMERESAEMYAARLTQHVSIPFHAAVGTDLDKQAKAFESIFKGHFAPPDIADAAANIFIGRKHKKEIIRKAWSNPEHPPIAEMLPLLNDFDLKILKLAFSFFQTLPMAKLEAIAPVFSSEDRPQQCKAGWLQAEDWFEGCRKLVEQSSPEVLRKFAFPWIKSAPLIYPFLAHWASSDPEKNEHLHSAWVRFNQESMRKRDRADDLDLHLLYFQDETKNRGQMRKILQSLGNKSKFIVVPVCQADTDSLAPSIELIQLAQKSGFKPMLSRFVPLCMLEPIQADMLLNAEAMEMSANQDPTTICLSTNARSGKNDTATCSCIRDSHRLFEHLSWVTTPYATCSTCGLQPLGLCQGGFFTKVPARE